MEGGCKKDYLGKFRPEKKSPGFNAIDQGDHKIFNGDIMGGTRSTLKNSIWGIIP